MRKLGPALLMGTGVMMIVTGSLIGATLIKGSPAAQPSILSGTPAMQPPPLTVRTQTIKTAAVCPPPPAGPRKRKAIPTPPRRPIEAGE